MLFFIPHVITCNVVQSYTLIPSMYLKRGKKIVRPIAHKIMCKIVVVSSLVTCKCCKPRPPGPPHAPGEEKERDEM